MKVLLLLVLSFNLLAFDHTHQLFDQVLQKRVQYKGHQSLVDYKGLKTNATKLNTYLKALSSVSKGEFKKFSEDEKLSFLINAYNGFTLKLIIDNYPVDSIKDIGGLFSSPWKKKFFKLLGKKMHLDGIEHGMIRRIFKEPRIHFAVNCASMGCPSLYNKAFVATKLEEQLEKVTMNFLRNTQKNRVKGQTLYVSKIFKWYGDDFMVLGSYKSFIKSKLGLSGDYDVEFLSYGWGLNKQ